MSSDSEDSDDLDKMIKTISTSAKKKKSGRKKKSRSSSNKNIKTTYRLGRLVNNDIHADGFTIKLEQSDGKFKFVMHVTFSQKDNPICISVANLDASSILVRILFLTTISFIYASNACIPNGFLLSCATVNPNT